MRLRSEVWVGAFVRRVFAEGAAAYVARRGDPDAGAVYIRIVTDDGARLFTPAPPWLTEDGDRLWHEKGDGAALSATEAETALQRELANDPDLWIVDVEDKHGRHFLDGFLIEEPHAGR